MQSGYKWGELRWESGHLAKAGGHRTVIGNWERVGARWTITSEGLQCLAPLQAPGRARGKGGGAWSPCSGAFPLLFAGGSKSPSLSTSGVTPASGGQIQHHRPE